MKKSPKSKVAYGPRLAEGDTRVADVCRQIGIAEARTTAALVCLRAPGSE